MLAAQRFRPRHDWTLGALLFLGAFTLGLTAIADGDIWWHLAAGREMVRTRSLLYTDPFSVSAGGRPWVDVHWLFQLGVYAVYRVGGLGALVVAKSLLIAGGATLLFTALARGSARRALWLFVIGSLSALFAVREQLQLRPVILTLVFLAFFFAKLEQFRAKPALRTLWALPLIQVVWANVQGLFLLGPALVSAYAFGLFIWGRFGERAWFPFSPEVRGARPNAQAWRLLFIALLLCSFACLLTPFGTRALSLPTNLLERLLPAPGNVFSANIAENVPPLASEHLLPGQFFHLKWFFGLLALALVAPGRRLLLSHVLLLAGLTLLALIANRNVLLLYWLGTPIAVMTVAPAARRGLRWLARRRVVSAARTLGYAGVASLLLLLGTAAARETELTAPAPFRVPERSASTIAESGGRGTIFAADNYGGYLIWKLFPEHRPYIDTRLILRTPAEYREYLAVVDEPSRFEAFQQRHGFEYVVLPTAYPDRYLGLIAHLYHSADWKLIYTDGTEALFVRRELSREPGWDLALRSTTTRILAAIDHEFAQSAALREAARVQLATLQLSLALFDQAEQALSGLTRPEAQALRARCRLAQGDSRQAREISLRLLKNDRNDVQSLNLLAILSLERGEPHEALGLLRRALAVDPFDAEAERILSSLEDQQHVESP